MRITALALWLSLPFGPIWAQDTLPWIRDMNRRMDELTRKDMTWRPTLSVTAEGEEWKPVSTVENAINVLCLNDLTLEQEVALYDFLDSAATELFRSGTPILLSTCHHLLHPEKIAAEEKANGYQFVCVAVLCSPGDRPLDGIALFNHRTRVLLSASAPLQPTVVHEGRRSITIGCDTIQAIDRTDLGTLKEWSDHWDSLLVNLPQEMLDQGAPKKEVRQIVQEQRVWRKARQGHCTSLAAGLPEGLYELKQLSCMEWSGRCRVVELTRTFHRIVPKMWYRESY